MEKLRISYPILVEGKYDRIRVSQIADAVILTTDGFGIFNQTEKRALLRTLAGKTPVIILTDSDAGGQVIRGALADLIPADRRIHVYTPRIPGKEKRKAKPGAEGILGVEGVEDRILVDLLRPFAGEKTLPFADDPVTKMDFYRWGLSGRAEAQKARDLLARSLSLPEGMQANALLAACRYLIGRTEFCAWAEKEIGPAGPENKKTD